MAKEEKLDMSLSAVEVRLHERARELKVGPYAPIPSRTDSELPPVNTRDIIAGFVLFIGAAAVLIAGANWLSTHQVVEVANATNGTSGIIFQCINDPDAAWQMVTHFAKPGGDVMHTAAQVTSSIRDGGFVDVAGKIYEHQPGQVTFHSIYNAIGRGITLSGVTDVCPAEMIVR